ncbi:hypothetical protein [uncultured Pontibacter sp.]|uniref:hypothetical protein n=1 Tax=uncultured Pontibacter sp. TaxID=453356 RepID=UPI002627D2EB|nr:hypothetical protein [uncultured Pontibacter sp.]
MRSELDELSELPLPDFAEVLLVDFPSFLDVEPDLAFELEDLEVEPEVLLPDVLLFGDKLELLGDELELPLVLLLPLELFDMLPDVDDDDDGLVLLDELPDDRLEF